MSELITKSALSSEEEKQHILIVEDNVDLRYTLSEWLRVQGYIVLEAATADEALVILHSSLIVNMVITDVHMPGSMNGITLADHIRATFPDKKVIIVSGEADRLEIPKDAAFFRKPYDLIEIAEHVAQMLLNVFKLNNPIEE